MEFLFDYKKYDFWVIYEDIKRFYPLGLDQQSPLFSAYNGNSMYEQALIDNIQTEENFNRIWVKFNEELVVLLGGKLLVDTTYGQCPSFSSFVELDRKEVSGGFVVVQLYFTVSLIGSYYTVLERTVYEKVVEGRNIIRSLYCWSSPSNEYSQEFELVVNKIENGFKGYRFVPNSIYTKEITGLKVYYEVLTLRSTSIYNALFNAQIDQDIQVFGDTRYKMEDWRL